MGVKYEERFIKSIFFAVRRVNAEQFHCTERERGSLKSRKENWAIGELVAEREVREGGP